MCHIAVGAHSHHTLVHRCHPQVTIRVVCHCLYVFQMSVLAVDRCEFVALKSCYAVTICANQYCTILVDDKRRDDVGRQLLAQRREMRFCTIGRFHHDTTAVETYPQIAGAVLNQRTHVFVVTCRDNVEIGTAHVGERHTKFGRPHPHGVVVVEIETRYVAAIRFEGFHSCHSFKPCPIVGIGKDMYALIARANPQVAIICLSDGIHKRVSHLLQFRQLSPLPCLDGEEPLCAGKRMRIVYPQVHVVVDKHMTITIVVHYWRLPYRYESSFLQSHLIYLIICCDNSSEVVLRYYMQNRRLAEIGDKLQLFSRIVIMIQSAFCCHP